MPLGFPADLAAAGSTVDTTAAAYEDFQYENLAFRNTHPDWLGTVGRIFGMSPARADACRVLELGCGPGGNLVPARGDEQRVAEEKECRTAAHMPRMDVPRLPGLITGPRTVLWPESGPDPGGRGPTRPQKGP